MTVDDIFCILFVICWIALGCYFIFLQRVETGSVSWRFVVISIFWPLVCFLILMAAIENIFKNDIKR